MVARLRAADERGAVGGWLDRIGVVRTVPATMAVSSYGRHRCDTTSGPVRRTLQPARADWGIPGSRHARLLRVNSIVGPLRGVPVGGCGRPRWCGADAGRLAGRRAERARGGCGPGRDQARRAWHWFAHERSGAAKVGIAVARQPGEGGRPGEPAVVSKSRPSTSSRPGAGESDLASPIGEGGRRVRDSSANGWSPPFRAP